MKEILRLIGLIQKQSVQELDAAERSELEQGLLQIDEELLPARLGKIWETTGGYKSQYEPDVEKGLARLKARIEVLEANKEPSRLNNRLKVLRWQIAAAVVVLVLGMAWIWRTYLIPVEIQYIELTGSGERKDLALPDGSAVVLNENSRLEYSNRLGKSSSREVRLSGEAFFDIASQGGRKFRVLTGQTEIDVLGTSFNVRAYPAENFTEVEVSSGTVGFSIRGREGRIVLKANEKGVFQRNQPLAREKVAFTNAQAWRTGHLKFVKTPIPEVEESLERYFKIDLNLESSNVQSCTFIADFEEASLEEVLQTLQTAFGIQIEKESDSSYRLKGGNCQ